LLKLVDFGLVKILASEEMTITILQGKGTALYTPLEQYGGDIGHTDARSDVYSFGATFYHLMTNRAPLEARELFLYPEDLIPPRDLNPNISPRTERAITWAMNLHPDDRPESIEELHQAMLGNRQPVTRPRSTRPVPSLGDLIFSSPLERVLLLISVGLVILSLVITLLL
jgi:serine/threonine-protein kinase